MAELLTRKDKTQISRWIGRDSQFELLYKLSRDGMSYQRFHELCDNKGPTVTIFYNTDNNVYGGYLSDSWGSTGTWCTDQGSFLFQLHSAVCTDSPWRHSPEWSSQDFQELKEFVANYTPFVEMKIPEVNILLIGPVAAGKSSFINTINTIFKGEMSSRVCPGCAENSLTQKFCKFRVRDPTTKKHLCFRICDTRGVEENFFIKSEDLSFLLDGNLPNNYTFQLDSGASTKEIGFVKEPTVKEKMHVVVFVLGGRSLDVLSEGVVSKLREIKRMVVDRNIPHLVFLTKTDEICDLVEKDVSKMFTSSLVEDAVNKAADIIDIPRSHVLPVKNYEKETILNMDINILALVALRKSLMFADDFLENLYDWQQDNIQTLDKRD